MAGINHQPFIVRFFHERLKQRFPSPVIPPSAKAPMGIFPSSGGPDSPLRPNQSGNEFKEEAHPRFGEKQFTKTVNSASIGTGLEQYLRSQSISSLVVVGLTTDHCVSTTVRMVGNPGFNVTLVADATATFERTGHNGAKYSAEEIHNIHLTSLNGEFCAVRVTGEVLAGG